MDKPILTSQERYLAHQERKKKVLIEIMEERHSNRIFSDNPVSEKDINTLLKTAEMCPSSCDRKGISLRLVNTRDELSLLGGILVGGVGWIHRSPNVFLIFANPETYIAGDEIKFMPYLDAGVVIQQLYLTATTLKLKCCFVNPNVREMNQDHFRKIFGDKLFCGAFAFGYEK